MTAPHPDMQIDGQPERGEFWYEVVINEGKETERVELKIDYRRFVAFLEKQGFGLLITDKQIQIVRVLDNVVSDCLKEGSINVTVKRFVLDWLSKKQRHDVEELMLKRHSTFFCTAFLTSLKPLALSFYRDTATASAIFFKNGFLRVRREKDTTDIAFLPYAKLDGAIWESHIIDKNYYGRHHDDSMIDDGDEGSEIEEFLMHCSTEYEEVEQQDGTIKRQALTDDDGFEITNLKAFKYAIGYACHTFKDPSNAKGIVCTDDDAKDFTDANGGRGKSIFAQIVGQCRRMSVEDGRTLKTDDNQFVLQSVELDSQIVLLDDVKPRFDFGILYNGISGVFALERKGRQRIILSFYDSPKIIVTTNYALMGDGDSHTRRWLILPFVNYFSAAYTPKDEFGHTLFDDWGRAEWMRFYDFVADCLAFYLEADKPVLADTAKYDDSKLQAWLPDEVLTFFEQRLSDIPAKGYTDYHEFMFDEFKWQYPTFNSTKSNKFTRYLKSYCKAKGLEINKHLDGRQWRTVPDANGTEQKVQELVFTHRRA